MNQTQNQEFSEKKQLFFESEFMEIEIRSRPNVLKNVEKIPKRRKKVGRKPGSLSKMPLKRNPLCRNYYECLTKNAILNKTFCCKECQNYEKSSDYNMIGTINDMRGYAFLLLAIFYPSEYVKSLQCVNRTKGNVWKFLMIIYSLVKSYGNCL